MCSCITWLQQLPSWWKVETLSVPESGWTIVTGDALASKPEEATQLCRGLWAPSPLECWPPWWMSHHVSLPCGQGTKLTPVRDQVERFWGTQRQSDAQSSLRASPATLWLQTCGNTCQTSPSQPVGARKHWLEHSSGQNWRSDFSRCDIDTKHAYCNHSQKKKNTICLCYFVKVMLGMRTWLADS